MKTILLVLIAIGLVTASTVLLVDAAATAGDVNDDGNVNSLDASLILQYDAGLLEDLGPRPTPTPRLGNSRSNPVPRGQSLTVPAGWRISITDFNPDAREQVLAENQFNTPPSEGMKFVLVRVRMTNVLAADPAYPDAGYALRLVGSRNVSYTSFNNSCENVIPDDIEDQSHDVFRDGTVEGNVCYEVPEDESGFVAFTDFFLQDDSDRRWFAAQ